MRGCESSPGLTPVKFRAEPPAVGISQISPFVLHASTLDGLEATTISFPSGVNEYGSVPPRDQVGQSDSPGVRSLGAPPVAGMTNTCLRFPSSQEDQCRAKRWSITRAFTLLAARSSAFFRLHASMAAPSPTHSG